MQHPSAWVVFAGGVGAGAVAGLFGVGGGLLLVPLLVLLLRQPQHRAHATSLVAVTMGASAALARFALDGSVAVAGAAALTVGAVTGARLGARLMPRITDRRLRALFAAVLLVIAVRFLVFGGGPAADGAETGAAPTLDGVRVALHVVGGVVAGGVSSLFGVGGGIVLVPLLVLGFGYGQHLAEGTSLAVIVPTALTGAVAHHRHSAYTDWRLGAELGVGAVLGAVAGAQVALGLDAATLGRLFGVLQAVVAALMLRGVRDSGA